MGGLGGSRGRLGSGRVMGGGRGRLDKVGSGLGEVRGRLGHGGALGEGRGMWGRDGGGLGGRLRGGRWSLLLGCGRAIYILIIVNTSC